MADEIRIPAGELQEFTKGVFVAAGVPSEDAALEAEVLVWANLRGVDSHGVLRIPWYVDLLAKGDMNARPNIRVERETAATALIDGDRALGPVVTTVAMRRAIDKARTAGIGWAVIRNTTHQGAMAYYALMAAEAGMAGIAIVCSPPNMAPFGARVAGRPQQPHLDRRAGRPAPPALPRHGHERGRRREAQPRARQGHPAAAGVGARRDRRSRRPTRTARRSSCPSAATRAPGSP